MKYLTTILLCLGISRGGLAQCISTCGYPQTLQLPPISCCGNNGIGAPLFGNLYDVSGPLGGCGSINPCCNLGVCGYRSSCPQPIYSPILRRFAGCPVTVAPYSSCLNNQGGYDGSCVFCSSRFPLLQEYIKEPVRVFPCSRAGCQSCSSTSVGIREPICTGPTSKQISPCCSGPAIQPISSCCPGSICKPISSCCSRPTPKPISSCCSEPSIKPTSTCCSGSTCQPIFSCGSGPFYPTSSCSSGPTGLQSYQITNCPSQQNIPKCRGERRDQRGELGCGDLCDCNNNNIARFLNLDCCCSGCGITAPRNYGPCDTGCCDLFSSYDPFYDLCSFGYRTPSCCNADCACREPITQQFYQPKISIEEPRMCIPKINDNLAEKISNNCRNNAKRNSSGKSYCKITQSSACPSDQCTQKRCSTARYTERPVDMGCK